MKFDTRNTGCDVTQRYVEDQFSREEQGPNKNRMFVPFSEDLLAAAGSPLGELVPFQLEYRCVRLLDGTYEFNTTLDSAAA
jgi:hypothetical protein